MKPGFYKLDQQDGVLRHAPNYVYAPNYTLLAAEHDTYTYPVEGWHWFDTAEDAEAFFNLNGATNARWIEFGQAVMADADVNAILIAINAANLPALAGGLTVGLGQAAQSNDTRTFVAAWTAAHANGFVSAAVITKLQGMAASFDLPAEFIAALDPQGVTP